MPPKPKTEVQRAKDKQAIVSAALEIITEHGLEGLSMRKLGTKLHMSGANVYNYFYNKDEIYLHILITGFELLNEKLKNSAVGCEEPLEELKRLCDAFIQFGTDYPSYYELMFCTKDPKSLDYIGTPMEELAEKEKAVSLVSFDLVNTLLTKYLPPKSESRAYIETGRIICELHGCINMNQTNILKEMGIGINEMKESVVDHIIFDLENR